MARDLPTYLILYLYSFDPQRQKDKKVADNLHYFVRHGLPAAGSSDGFVTFSLLLLLDAALEELELEGDTLTSSPPPNAATVVYDGLGALVVGTQVDENDGGARIEDTVAEVVAEAV